MNFRVVLAFVVFVGLVIVGGVAWKGLNAFSGFAAEAAGKLRLCSSLTDTERRDLVGVPTPTRLAGAEGDLDHYSCRWATQDYKSVIAFVEVVSAPAAEWGTQSQRTLTGQNPIPARVLRKLSHQPIQSEADGCRFAQRIFALSGARHGAQRVVAPTSVRGVPAMMAQSCVGGTYTAVMVVAPGLTLNRSLAHKTARALRTVEQRLSVD